MAQYFKTYEDRFMLPKGEEKRSVVLLMSCINICPSQCASSDRGLECSLNVGSNGAKSKPSFVGLIISDFWSEILLGDISVWSSISCL